MSGTWRNGHRSLIGLVAGLALTLSGCGLGGQEHPSSNHDHDHGDHDHGDHDSGPVQVAMTAESELHSATMTVEVSGDINLSWSSEAQDLRIVTFPAEHFLSVGVQEMLFTDEGELFRFAFDLFGTYVGEGPFVVPASDVPLSERDMNVEDMSNTFFHYGRLVAPDEDATEDNIAHARVFDRPGSSCTVDVAADETTGRVRCPELRDAEGRSIHLVWTWTLLDEA